MPHHWDITHARWVPTIPQVGTVMAVFAAPLIGSSGMVVPPPLPQIGTAGHRSPIPMGVPPTTMVTGLSAPTTTLDDTVEMAVNMSPPPAYGPRSPFQTQCINALICASLLQYTFFYIVYHPQLFAVTAK